MSRHDYQVARGGREPLLVTAGWDRPCGHFFLQVLDPERPGEREVLYDSSLDLALYAGQVGAAFGGLSFAELTGKLRELALPSPAGLLETLAREAEGNVGNHQQRWGRVG